MLPFAYSRHSQSEFSASDLSRPNGEESSQASSQASSQESSQENLLSATVLDKETAAVVRYCTDQGWDSPQWQIEKSADWRRGFSDRLDEPQGGEQDSVNHSPIAGLTAGKPVWIPPASSDIVIYSLQRMFNSARDMDLTLAWLRDRDVALHVVALSAEISQTRTYTRTKVDFDYMLREMLTLEVRRGTERMKRVKQKQRQKGRFLGGSKPFGYMVHSNGKLIENPLEQKVLRQIYQLRQRGHSLRDIARQVSTPVAPVSFKTVQRILQRPGESNV